MRRGRGVRMVVAVATVSLVGSLTVVAPAAAKTVTGSHGVRLTVASATVRGTGELRITVKGSGYSTTRNNGFGIYLSYGEKPLNRATNDTWARDVTRYFDKGDGRGTKWIHPGTATSLNQAVLRPDGTFKTSLSVKKTFVAKNGKRYPRNTSQPLGILTYAAHGTETARNSDGKRTGYSQYAFLKLTIRKPASRSSVTAVATDVTVAGQPTAVAAARAGTAPDAIRPRSSGRVSRRRRPVTR